MLKYTIKTLFRNKMRSALTTLGVIIGVWAVILLVAIGNGLKVYIEQQFQELGSNMAFVLPGQYFDTEGNLRATGDMSALGGAEFDEKDLDELERIKQTKYIIPAVYRTVTISKGREKMIGDLLGSSANYPQARNLDLVEGRFFTETEVDRGREVVVIGHQIKEKLFGDQSPLGERIEIEDDRYKIIGVAEKKGGGMSNIGMASDTTVYTPYEAVWDITGQESFNLIFLIANQRENLETVKSQARKILSEEYEKEEFTVADQSEFLGMINEILSMVTAALGGIAAISLIVGGIGIMNTMYASVTERTKEIGLRKAVGATNQNIRNQFLTESAILSVSGGTIGLLLSIGSVLAMQKFFPAQITLWSVLLAVGVSIFVGIIFGLAPARRASKLTPVEALRYE